MAWAKPAGAWAQAVEDEEAEAGGSIVAPTAAPPAPPSGLFPELGAAKKSDKDFPSLGAASKKESKKERKKKQTLSLADFQRTTADGQGTAFRANRGAPGTAYRPRGSQMTDDEILRSLPTQSRGMAEGEVPGERLGGGFGDDRRRGFGDRDDDDAGPSRADASDSWGMDRKFQPGAPAGRGFGGGSFGAREERQGGFGDDGGPPPGRADEVDDWGANRRAQPAGPERRGFGGSFADREERPGFGDRPDGPPAGRADEVDDWGANRQFQPSQPERRGFGGGFNDERRGGFGEGFNEERRGFGGFADRGDRPSLEPSRADLEDRWASKGPAAGPTGFEARTEPPRRGFEDGAAQGRDLDGESTWRRADVPPARPESAGSAGSGAAAARGRPRLNLAPRTLPIEKPAEPNASANIFGGAKPREERSEPEVAEPADVPEPAAEPVQRETTAEEKALAGRIIELSARVEAGEGEAPLDASAGPGEPGAESVDDALAAARDELEALTIAEDRKAREPRKEASEPTASPTPAAGRADDANSWRRAPAPASPDAASSRPAPRGREGWGRDRRPGSGQEERAGSRERPARKSNFGAPREGGW